MEHSCDPPMQDESSPPPHFWPMVRSFLTLKADLDPLPVFDHKGRPIGFGKLWWVDEHHHLQGQFLEGCLEVPAFSEEDEGNDDLYDEEWGEEVLMLEPVRSHSQLHEPSMSRLENTRASPNSRLKDQILWWEDLQETAHPIFDPYPSTDGLQLAWHLLIQTGHARYAMEWERHLVLVRFVTLGFLWQTSQIPQKDAGVFPLDEYSFAWITKHLGLSPYRLGWLAGHLKIDLPDSTPDSTEFELTTQVLPRLAERERPGIVTILQNHFGGAERLSAFFSQHFPPHPWEDAAERESTDELPPEGTPQQQTAMLAWVKKGCPFPANLFL